MGRISVPVQDLKDTANELQRIKVFAENTDKISENFTKTDEDSAKSLDESKKNA
ncbi:hypothetical protein [Streptomyces sp. NEAU-S7GS2]|uniref:hypothetical protein n=1 Tax=Streptomyces sp. NEAU-S7GS2 TaxID=2202000 RepID=UPI0019526249|nr:hypothetical protein [Streptomyces sp. NEAU-S7GS2]